jgi:hypothetical protein
MVRAFDCLLSAFCEILRRDGHRVVKLIDLVGRRWAE